MAKRDYIVDVGGAVIALDAILSVIATETPGALANTTKLTVLAVTAAGMRPLGEYFPQERVTVMAAWTKLIFGGTHKMVDLNG